MTLCACIIPSAYDFTFALPSALYEPILALACPYNALPLRFISIPSRHDPLLHLRTGLPCLSFTTQFCSIGFLCFSAPLQLYSRALLIITITALAVSFPLLSHNAAIIFYSIAALHFTLPSPRRCPASQFYTSPLPFFPHLCHCFLHLFYGQVKPRFCVPDGKDISFCAYLY